MFSTRIRKEAPLSRRPRTAPRKNPKQARSQATVDAILGAAARILCREGFDHASTNRIAALAGVSVGSLYQYFPTKEAIIATLVDRHVEAMTSLIVSNVERLMAAPIAVAARELVTLMLEAHAVDPKLHKALVEQIPRTGRLDRLYDVERRNTALVRAYLEAHRDELRPIDLDVGAFVVVHLVEGVTHAAVIHRPERLSDPALVDEIVRLLVAYLARDDRKSGRLAQSRTSSTERISSERARSAASTSSAGSSSS